VWRSGETVDFAFRLTWFLLICGGVARHSRRDLHPSPLGTLSGMPIAFSPPMAEAEKTETHEVPKKSSSGAIGIGIGVLLLVVAGVWFARRSGTPVASSVDGEVAATLHLDTFVLNLADPGQRSYARVGIDLGLSRPLGKIRDTIIGVIGQVKADDLASASGKAKLKEDLLHALQQRQPGLGVEDVYFTEFLIQR
jgi:flagellar basal body-associated protein FliL